MRLSGIHARLLFDNKNCIDLQDSIVVICLDIALFFLDLYPSEPSIFFSSVDPVHLWLILAI